MKKSVSISPVEPSRLQSDTTDDPVTKNIGKCIRQQRLSQGHSLQELSQLTGMTYQQIQKYESGTNRISADQIFHLAISLEKPISNFFPPVRHVNNNREKYGNVANLNPREITDLVKCYSMISDKKLRKSLFDLIKNIGDRIDEV